MEANSPVAREVARLERLLAGDPAAPAFPALAEAHRRAGDPKRAEAVARAGLAARPGETAGRVALGLALLDQGRAAEARAELERALETCSEHVLARRALAGLGAAPEGDLEGEIEQALAAARPESEAMLDANELAAEAMRRLGVDERGELDTSERSPFATRTVAELLERQGEPGRAETVRRSLERRGGSGEPDRRARVITRLERWLARIGRSSR